MSTSFKIEIIERLENSHEASEWMDAAFQLGLDNGYWSKRDGPGGAELCAMARDESGAIVGGVTFFCLGHNRGWIDLVFVVPEARGRGVGAMLIEAIKADLFSRGLGDIEFGTFDNNAAMQSLGNKTGFKTTGLIMSVCADGGAS